MDQQEETEVKQEEINIVDLNEIEYYGKTIVEWEEELSVIMPDLPCTSIEIDQTCAKLNNKYQIAYNTYNGLFVKYKELQSRARRLMIVKVEELYSDYATRKVRAPGRERMEDIARNSSEAIRTHEDRLVKVSILKDYFENHKNKLKDMMLLTNSISYSVNQSDRMFDKSSRTNGM